MLRIVMDSAGDIPQEWLSEFDVHVIPVNIHFGEKMFLQGVDLSNAEFYKLAEESGVIPKTSQPTPHQFEDFYNRIAEPGDTILSIHVTSKLSGTFASAQAAARNLIDKFKVIPFDSASGSAAMGYMCRDVRLMERAGASIEKILERLDSIRKRTNIILTLNTLEYARKSGRVKALQAALASILNVKPIVILREGVLEVGEKVRTRKRSLDFVVNEIKERVENLPVNVAVVHAEDLPSAEMLVEKVKSVLNCAELIVTELSTGVAANLGPGTVGVVAYPVEGG